MKSSSEQCNLSLAPGIPPISAYPRAYTAAVRNNLWTWQDLSPDSGPGQDFFEFCDALEVKSGVSAPAAGWGLDHALQAWGSYWKNSFYQQSTSLICHNKDISSGPVC